MKKKVKESIQRALTLSLEWQKEIEKRCRDIDDGTVELKDADAVFERAFASLAHHF